MQKQVLVLFSIEKYHDEVLCDVVLMYASHILLGRPWQFDRRTNYDGFKNRFSFMKDKKLVTFVPLTPKQVYGDQENKSLIQKRLRKKKKEKKKRKQKKRKKIERRL